MSLGQIDHIVVLMLENRSFDSMLGKLYPKSATFDGLDGTEQNPDSSGVPVQVWSSTGTDESTMRIPGPDPGAGLLIDTVVCLTLAKWETGSGQFGGYLSPQAANGSSD